MSVSVDVSSSGIGNDKKKDSGSGNGANVTGMHPFAEYFKKKLEGRNLREFADKTGSSVPAISKAQNDKAAPPLRHITAWALELSLSPAETEEFRALARDRRIAAKADSAERYEEIQEALKRRSALLSELLAILAEESHHLPKQARLRVKELLKTL